MPDACSTFAFNSAEARPSQLRLGRCPLFHLKSIGAPWPSARCSHSAVSDWRLMGWASFLPVEDPRWWFCQMPPDERRLSCTRRRGTFVAASARTLPASFTLAREASRCAPDPHVCLSALRDFCSERTFSVHRFICRHVIMVRIFLPVEDRWRSELMLICDDLCLRTTRCPTMADGMQQIHAGYLGRLPGAQHG